MSAAGFEKVIERSIWETRRVYVGFSELAEDLRNRTGRSILHELSDNALEDLIDFVEEKLTDDEVIVERDRWTI